MDLAFQSLLSVRGGDEEVVAVVLSVVVMLQTWLIHQTPLRIDPNPIDFEPQINLHLSVERRITTAIDQREIGFAAAADRKATDFVAASDRKAIVIVQREIGSVVVSVRKATATVVDCCQIRMTGSTVLRLRSRNFLALDLMHRTQRMFVLGSNRQS